LSKDNAINISFLFLSFFSFSYVQRAKRMYRRWKESEEHATEKRWKGCDHIDQKKTPGLEPANNLPCSPTWPRSEQNFATVPLRGDATMRESDTAVCTCYPMMDFHMCAKQRETSLDPLASQLAQQSQSQLGPMSASTMISCVACYSSICRR
jgi:hypothetical protein